MSIISTTIPNLINGVSQQPYALRLASQAEAQINAYSSVVEGLRKRPPTKLAAKISNAPTTQAKMHLINRDASERYSVVITNGGLRVFTLAGVERYVSFPTGTGYLNATYPETAFECLTVADYTFVLNRSVQTQAVGGDIVPPRPYEALVWVKQGAYSTRYSVSVNGTSVSYTTKSSEFAVNQGDVQTTNIAYALQLGLQLGAVPPGADASQYAISGPALSGFTIANLGSTLYLQSASDFSLFATDGLADSAIKPIKGTVQRFSDLPARGWPGFRVRVAGTNDNAFDDYYVEFEAESGGGGTWKESAKGGEIRRLNPYTMPHALVRNPDGSFTFRQIDWASRKVGDLESVPMPSFVGRALNDIFFHRNRLGVLADENVVMSRAGDFFNFFRASALQTLDTDPIDIAASHVKVSILRHAIPFNESLLLFSDQSQFVLSAGDLLTPKTASISQTTEFECSLLAKPVGAGQNVYFAVQRGEFTGIREYFVDGDTRLNDAADVTAHCPRYIPKNVSKLAASSNEDVMVALSWGNRSQLSIYRYYWSGGEKLQSSWSKWDFPGTDQIMAVDFIESELWLVVSRPDGTYLESVSLEPGYVDAPATFSVHLDRRITEQRASLAYDAASNTTVITLPYAMLGGEVYQLICWGGWADRAPGEIVPWTAVSPTQVRVDGYPSKFFWGRQYQMLYRFSTLIVREDAAGGNGQQPIGEGRLQLRRMTLSYSGTGYFRVEVTPKYRNLYRYVFSGRVVGSGQNVIGQVAIEQGTFRFPVASKNDQVQIDIVNDSPLPSTFLSAEWEGFFQIRSKRL